MNKEKILIVEDDNDLANLITDYLRIEGYEGVIADSGTKALEVAKSENISLVILDIMLPEVDGITVCRKIREHSHVPIIMLSAKSGEMDKILSLGVGADDYVTKPFSPMELLARVKAQIRRAGFVPNEVLEREIIDYGDLKIYPQNYKVVLSGSEISLTTKEFQVLEYLAKNSGKVFTKEQLYDGVWGLSEFMDENTIAVYVKRLRSKLGDIGKKSIKTVWGVGYKWEYCSEQLY
ncbi:response regulator transcription factor [Paraclostridium ghonii]|uniref:Stage 0 sporulation protein A homolog n=1 Tax=Paraclostridium ghonii TaxID=29358 RepID=A0ABU0MZP4_9FIRM|nr:response regulator transcription factor [Paeniclostridium ghonii]MDQ0556379.1 DNA-binding response OmpR family regulator [Paeniclostridium ghonii]